MMKISFVGITGLVGLVLVGCTSVGPKYAGPPDLKVESGFAQEPRDGSGAGPVEWWRQLGDARLDQLVAQALREGFDLQLARERLVQARAARRGVRALYRPQAVAGGGYSRVELSESTADFAGQALRSGQFPNGIEQYDVGLDFSWEIDVFGGGRRQIESAQAEIGSTVEAIHGVRLAVVTEVVETYFTIVGLREELDAIERNIQLRRETRDLVVLREQEGLASELDVERAEVRWQSALSERPGLHAALVAQLRRLTLLLGETPGALDDRLDQWASFPAALPMVRAGVPSGLLHRRPDLRGLERDLARVSAEIGVAKARFYPRFFLFGKPEAVSGRTANLFDAESLAWQWAPRFEWALFSGGRNRALLAAANSQQRASLIRYERGVLQAIGEVESQRAALTAEHQGYADLKGAVQAAERAVALAEAVYAAGRSSVVDLLIEQEQLTTLRGQLARRQTALVLAWVNLHRALGGGWELPENGDEVVGEDEQELQGEA